MVAVGQISSLCTKSAELGLLGGKAKNVVGAFIRQYDPLIGEELTHRITGQRFFRGANQVNSRNVAVTQAPPIEITENGYRGISPEYFDGLKQMKLYLKNTQYGGKEIVDGFTGKHYWARQNKLGETVTYCENPTNFMSRENVPANLWNRLIKYFQ